MTIRNIVLSGAAAVAFAGFAATTPAMAFTHHPATPEEIQQTDALNAQALVNARTGTTANQPTASTSVNATGTTSMTPDNDAATPAAPNATMPANGDDQDATTPPPTPPAAGPTLAQPTGGSPQ